MTDLRDAVYGAAIGDALGVPYEFRARGSFECTGMASGGAHGQQAGTFSDDTSMMLATCDSIRELGRIDCDDIRERFEAWYYRGEYTVDGEAFDCGNTVLIRSQILRRLATGRSAGNRPLCTVKRAPNKRFMVHKREMLAFSSAQGPIPSSPKLH